MRSGAQRYRWDVFGAAFLTVFSLATLWAFAGPVFAVPDENAHVANAVAQVRGQLFGEQVEGEKHPVVRLPEEFRFPATSTCFAFHPERSAGCAAELGAGNDRFGTWVDAYNPAYYALVGWPSLLVGGEAGLYSMRVTSAMLCAVLIAAAFQLAVVGRPRAWLPMAVGFAAAPMNVFLMGSVNPNGVEIAAGVALWVAALRLLESNAAEDPDGHAERPSGWYLWLVATISAALLANARALGPLWVAVILLLAVLVVGWSSLRGLLTTRASVPWIVAIALACGFSVAWTLGGGSLSGQASEGDAPLVGGSFLAGAAYMIRHLPDFLVGAVGIFGWLDTILPIWVYWLPVVAAGTVLVLSVTATRRRSTTLVLLVAASSVVVPTLVQARSVAQTGIIWQGRYGLVLLLGVLIVAGWVLSGRSARRVLHVVDRMSWVVAALVASFGVLAFAFVLYRYMVGTEGALSEMWRSPGWEPPVAWWVLIASYVVASAALTALVGMTTRSVVRRSGLVTEVAAR
ncbi:DUF2142 domain-containing protein [Agromyces sp. SYSU T00266]|uniref:DUF2142 domain-containing protein n=1 Tax=Agromyces zhanjiangensis TaxID=3158562 RepID=UPI003392702D